MLALARLIFVEIEKLLYERGTDRPLTVREHYEIRARGLSREPVEFGPRLDGSTDAFVRDPQSPEFRTRNGSRYFLLIRESELAARNER